MTGPQFQREHIKEKRAAQKKKNTLTWAIGIAVVLLVLAAVYFLPSLGGSKADLYLQDGFAIGDPNAPVKVEQFSDFRCHYCRQFSDEMEQDFIKNYVDTGKVYFTFRNYPFLAEDSTTAAEAAYCAADQNKFWQYKELLFNYNALAGAYAESNLVDYARQVGLDTNTFEACLAGDAHLADLAADKAYTEGLGITSTPQFNVNGTIVYMNTLIETVDAALGTAGN